MQELNNFKFAVSLILFTDFTDATPSSYYQSLLHHMT